MESPVISILSDPEEAAREAANCILDAVHRAVSARGVCRLVLSGGATPKRLYAMLAESPFCDRFPWTCIHFFWTDERAVAPDHSESNYRMADEALLRPMRVPSANIHRMRGEAEDLDGAARDYEAEMRSHFNLTSGTPPPSFDLVLLGLGADGHTASLFPSAPALQETRRWVVHTLTAARARLTLTLPILNRAAVVLFLVCGREKADILAQVLEGPPDRFPAQQIRPTAAPVRWIVDRAAACRLGTSEQ
jgi:6-phosphogluconolactonase